MGGGSGGSGVAKMNKIEKSLFLGNMEAATDVILLESHGITHVVTLDTIPLPRKASTDLSDVISATCRLLRCEIKTSFVHFSR